MKRFAALILLVASTAHATPFTWGAVTSSTQTLYASTSAISTVETEAQIVGVSNGRFAGMSVVCGATITSGSYVFTLRKGSADTALTCTISAGQNECTVSTATTVDYSSAQALALKVAPGGSPTHSGMRCTVQHRWLDQNGAEHPPAVMLGGTQRLAPVSGNFCGPTLNTGVADAMNCGATLGDEASFVMPSSGATIGIAFTHLGTAATNVETFRLYNQTAGYNMDPQVARPSGSAYSLSYCGGSCSWNALDRLVGLHTRTSGSAQNLLRHYVIEYTGTQALTIGATEAVGTRWMGWYQSDALTSEAVVTKVLVPTRLSKLTAQRTASVFSAVVQVHVCTGTSLPLTSCSALQLAPSSWVANVPQQNTGSVDVPSGGYYALKYVGFGGANISASVNVEEIAATPTVTPVLTPTRTPTRTPTYTNTANTQTPTQTSTTTPTCGSGAYAAAVNADLPLAYWRLGDASGTTAEEEANTYDGTYSGSPTLGVAGALTSSGNTAMTTGSGAAVMSRASFPALGMVSWTIEWWMKLASTSQPTRYAINHANAPGIAYAWSGGVPNLEILGWTGATASDCNLGTYIESGWDTAYHHIAYTYDYPTGTVTAYMDGTPVNGASGCTLPNTVADLIVGGQAASSIQHLNATFDEVAIYAGSGKALSATRIAAHRAAALCVDSAFTPTRTPTPTWTATLTPTLTPTISQTPTRTPTLTPTQTAAYTCAAGSYAAGVASDGATAHWRLGDSGSPAVDAITGTYNGTYSGSPTFGATGAIASSSDTAVNFTAASDKMLSAALPTNSGGFAIELWFKTNDDAQSATYVLDTGGPDIAYGWTGDTMHLFWFQGGGCQMSVPITVPATGWHHYVYTWDGSNIVGYLDGVAVVTTAHTGCPSSFAMGAVTLGESNTNTGNVDAQIDELAIYEGKALTASQVANHYASGICGGTGTATQTPTVTRTPTWTPTAKPTHTPTRTGTATRTATPTYPACCGNCAISSGDNAVTTSEFNDCQLLNNNQAATFGCVTNDCDCDDDGVVNPADSVIYQANYNNGCPGQQTFTPTATRTRTPTPTPTRGQVFYFTNVAAEQVVPVFGSYDSTAPNRVDRQCLTTKTGALDLVYGDMPVGAATGHRQLVFRCMTQALAAQTTGGVFFWTLGAKEHLDTSDAVTSYRLDVVGPTGALLSCSPIVAVTDDPQEWNANVALAGISQFFASPISACSIPAGSRAIASYAVKVGSPSGSAGLGPLFPIAYGGTASDLAAGGNGTISTGSMGFSQALILAAATATPTPTPTISVSPTPTRTPTAAFTGTVTRTPTNTWTPTITPTNAGGVTNTPANTATHTPTLTRTRTPTTAPTNRPTPKCCGECGGCPSASSCIVTQGEYDLCEEVWNETKPANSCAYQCDCDGDGEVESSELITIASRRDSFCSGAFTPTSAATTNTPTATRTRTPTLTPVLTATRTRTPTSAAQSIAGTWRASWTNTGKCVINGQAIFAHANTDFRITAASPTTITIKDSSGNTLVSNAPVGATITIPTSSPSVCFASLNTCEHPAGVFTPRDFCFAYTLNLNATTGTGTASVSWTYGANTPTCPQCATSPVTDTAILTRE